MDDFLDFMHRFAPLSWAFAVLLTLLASSILALIVAWGAALVDLCFFRPSRDSAPYERHVTPRCAPPPPSPPPE